MCEIKFRGMNLCGKWVYGDLRHDRMCMPDGKLQEYISVCGEPIHPKSVGQFTGLTDANGQEIYEGDVVAFSDYGGTTHKGKVYFRDGAFFITQPGMEYGYRLYTLVKLYYPAFVIGNVHDSPELLEGKDA